jgi:hypothetical protein
MVSHTPFCLLPPLIFPPSPSPAEHCSRKYGITAFYAEDFTIINRHPEIGCWALFSNAAVT